MIGIARLGDTSDHGGTIITGSATFLANGLKGCIDGDLHSCPIRDHGVTAINGTANFTSNDKRGIKVGDRAGCGATITTGSPSISTD